MDLSEQKVEGPESDHPSSQIVLYGVDYGLKWEYVNPYEPEGISTINVHRAPEGSSKLTGTPDSL